jgi:hypothetical protein
MLLEPRTAKKVTLTILYLHNFLRKSMSRALYNPNGAFDTDCPITGETCPGIWRQAPSTFINIPRIPRRNKMDVQAVRNEFAKFFSSPEGCYLFNKTDNKNQT